MENLVLGILGVTGLTTMLCQLSNFARKHWNEGLMNKIELSVGLVWLFAVINVMMYVLCIGLVRAGL